MIISLVAHEKNLGILPLTDYILEKLGKDNCAVLGANYLAKDYSKILDLIEEFGKHNKNIIIKYIFPKQKFSNQDIVFPDFIKEKSDLILRVPKFSEEMMSPVPLQIFKGEDNPFIVTIRNYYIS